MQNLSKISPQKGAPLLITLPRALNTSKVKSYFPFSCMQLFNYLHLHNVHADILDFSILLDDFTTEKKRVIHITNSISTHISTYQPLFLGFNCFTSGQFPLICNIAECLKRLFPHLPICVGGAHASLFPMEIIENYSYFDYVIIGEGEEQTLALIKYFQGTLNTLDQVQAIAYRAQEGKIIYNKRVSFLDSLEIPQFPAWNYISADAYKTDTTTWNNPKGLAFDMAIPIMTTRSCPFSCNFCSVAGFMGHTLRRRNPTSILDEIEYFHKELGKNYFEFIDDNINVHKEHAKTIFSGIINRKLNIHFSMTNGIHLPSADTELIDIMAEAGLAMFKLPIEHGNDYIRNNVIKKKLSRQKIFEIVERINRYDIFTFALFIMGFPEDTEETLNDSLQMMQELNCDINMTAILIPFPGTAVFKQCAQDNLFINSTMMNNIHSGKMLLDSSDNSIYIKPYAMSIEQLLHYKNLFNCHYLNSEKSKKTHLLCV